MNSVSVDCQDSSKSKNLTNRRIVIVGSSPAAPEMATLIDDATTVVAVNNAWRALSRFDFLVYPPDFPHERRPDPNTSKFSCVEKKQYIRGCRHFGGEFFGGETMAFAAGYWALEKFPGSQIAFCASDMTYDQADGQTHFYGKGQADPLRSGLSLINLEALSCRMFYKGFTIGSLALNITHETRTRLRLPQIPYRLLGDKSLLMSGLEIFRTRYAHRAVEIAHHAEKLESEPPFDCSGKNYRKHGRDPIAIAYVTELRLKWSGLLDIISLFSEDLRQLATQQRASG